MNRTLARARSSFALALFVQLTTNSAHSAAPTGFAWNDGDRVVLIGDTLLERDQAYGFLETRIIAENPEKSITFRNLGWSGDTVRGLSRAGFGPPADGLRQLKDHVLALRPTVLIVGYGMSESFEGATGLASFRSGLNELLDSFAPLKARLILLSPIAHETLPPPLPDPTVHNASLKAYRDTIEAVAKERSARFVDLFEPFRAATAPGIAPLTDDGLHLDARGAWFFARVIDRSLRNPGEKNPTLASLDRDGAIGKTTGLNVTGVKSTRSSLSFDASREFLPAQACPEPGGTPASAAARLSVLKIAGLAAGTHTLRVDGGVVAKASANEWAEGVAVESGPDFDQVEALRKAINAKNQLYFYRWRPQNETYLFGFRKHEQGNNAREIPLFDPLVEAREKEIAALKIPRVHHYQLALDQ